MNLSANRRLAIRALALATVAAVFLISGQAFAQCRWSGDPVLENGGCTVTVTTNRATGQKSVSSNRNCQTGGNLLLNDVNVRTAVVSGNIARIEVGGVATPIQSGGQSASLYLGRLDTTVTNRQIIRHADRLARGADRPGDLPVTLPVRVQLTTGEWCPRRAARLRDFVVRAEESSGGTVGEGASLDCRTAYTAQSIAPAVVNETRPGHFDIRGVIRSFHRSCRQGVSVRWEFAEAHQGTWRSLGTGFLEQVNFGRNMHTIVRRAFDFPTNRAHRVRHCVVGGTSLETYRCGPWQVFQSRPQTGTHIACRNAFPTNSGEFSVISMRPRNQGMNANLRIQMHAGAPADCGAGLRATLFAAPDAQNPPRGLPIGTKEIRPLRPGRPMFTAIRTVKPPAGVYKFWICVRGPSTQRTCSIKKPIEVR